MLENSALAGVISSVVILSTVFKLICAFKCCSGASGIGSGWMFGPRTISTFFASSSGSGSMIMESSTGNSSGSFTSVRTDRSLPRISSALAKVPVMAVAAALSGLTR